MPGCHCHLLTLAAPVCSSAISIPSAVQCLGFPVLQAAAPWPILGMLCPAVLPCGTGKLLIPREWFGANNALFSYWLDDVVQVGGDFFLDLLPILGSLCIYILQCYSTVWENGLPSLYTLPTM